MGVELGRLTTVYVTLLGEPELLAKFRAMDLAAMTVAKRITNKHALDITNGIKENAPVDRGRLRASTQIKHYQVGFSQGITADITVESDYAAFMEFGTGPAGRQMSLFGGPLPEGYVHGNGGKMPPLKLIIEWVKRKGIVGKNPKDTPEQIGYLIARKIARDGLAARPFVWPAYMAVRPKWEADMRTYLDEFMRVSGAPSAPRRLG